MVKGLGAGFSSVYSHFASPLSVRRPVQLAVWLTVITPRQHADGKRERLQLEHQQHHVFGQMMYQTGSGATATQTRDGIW